MKQLSIVLIDEVNIRICNEIIIHIEVWNWRGYCYYVKQWLKCTCCVLSTRVSQTCVVSKWTR